MDWFRWRPVLEGLGTLHEVETAWTLEDVQDAHDLLDLRHSAQVRT